MLKKSLVLFICIISCITHWNCYILIYRGAFVSALLSVIAYCEQLSPTTEGFISVILYICAKLSSSSYSEINFFLILFETDMLVSYTLYIRGQKFPPSPAKVHYILLFPYSWRLYREYSIRRRNGQKTVYDSEDGYRFTSHHFRHEGQYSYTYSPHNIDCFRYASGDLRV